MIDSFTTAEAAALAIVGEVMGVQAEELGAESQVGHELAEWGAVLAAGASAHLSAVKRPTPRVVESREIGGLRLIEGGPS